MKRILITGCGGFAALGFVKCLKMASHRFYLVGTDNNAQNIFFSKTDRTYLIPPCSDKNYIPALNKIIKKEKIDLIYSQPQIEIQAISQNRDQLLTPVFLPDKETIELCYDKYKTITYLSQRNIPVPKTILFNNKKDLTKSFKVLGQKIWLREIKGVAGKGAFLADNINQATFWLELNHGWDHFTASEYLPGINYGCDMLFYQGALIFSVLKERLEYLLAKANIMGITGTTGILKTVNNIKISQFCEQVVRSLDNHPHGLFAVDLKNDGQNIPHVTEVNCGRFLSSSIMLFYKSNFHAPLYTIKVGLGYRLPAITNKYCPLPEDLILSRQPDDEPVLFNTAELTKLKNRQKRNIAFPVI